MIPYITRVIFYYGYKQGDINCITLYSSNTIFASQMDEETIKGVKQPIYGQLIVQLEQYSGEEGQKLLKEQQQCGFQIQAICQLLEIPLIIACGMESTINAGLDYYNTDDMIKSMRKNKFNGCSGSIKLDSKSNFRDTISFYFTNEITDSEGKQKEINKEIYCLTCSIVWLKVNGLII